MARKRGTKWQADARASGGKRIQFATEQEAVAYERSYENGFGGVSSPVTLGPFIAAHFDDIWRDIKRPDAVQMNVSTILQYFEPGTALAAINNGAVFGFINWLRSRGLANGTINRKLSTLSKILRHAALLELIPRRPDMTFQKEGVGRERVLDKQEEVALIGRAEHLGMAHTAALIRFLTYTGCRLGEAYKLEWEDVDADTILLRDTKNGSSRIIIPVPQTKDALAFLRKGRGDSTKVFAAIPRDTFRGHWNRLRNELGHGDDECFVPHMLRHTCATRLVKAGIPLPQVMKWMGHKNIQTTMKYSHLASSDLHGAARALSEA
jgi:integrase